MPKQRQQMVLLSAGASLPRSTCPRRPRETRGGRGGEGRPSGDEAPYPPQNGRNSNRLAALARLGCSAGLQLGWAGLGCGLGFLALGHHFETKTTATNRTSQYWGITSMPKQQQQQIVLLSAGASLRAKATEIHDTSWH